MSSSFGSSQNQERRKDERARNTGETLADLGDSFRRGRDAEEPHSGSSGTIRRRVGTSESSQTGGAQLPSRRSASGADEVPERAASCRPSAAPSSVQASAGGYRRPASSGSGSLSGSKTIAASGTTSNSQRLSSIEILNENKQRQLQLEQQESFKQHLEQRQRFIQQQGRDGAGDHAYSAYQVEPSEADYARMAAAANAARQQANGTSAARKQAVSVAVNPFDEEPPYPSGRSVADSDQNEPTTVSGRSGFLATLMGETAEATKGTPADGNSTNSAGKQQMFDESGEELDSSSGDASGSRLHGSTRYAKVAQSAARSYDYDGSQRDKRPFYSKDMATLLAECRGSRKLVILIVAVALLLDNMLLTAVVPIIPAYLYKLRVYRQHHGELSLAGAANKSSTGRFNPLDTNQNGRVDEDEFQAELDRRVNESLATQANRFSGSFFHPRVLKQRDNFGNIIEADDDDDGDDSLGGDPNEQRSMRRQNQRGGRYPRAQMSPGASSRNSKFDMDEYETNDDDDKDDDDGGPKSSDKINGRTDRERKLVSGRPDGQKSASKARSSASRSASSKSKEKGDSAGGQKIGNSDEDDEDDDEDAALARRWRRLRSSLDVIYKQSGNDTDLLAGVCLSQMLDRVSFLDGQQSGDKNSPPEELGRSSAKSKTRNDEGGGSGGGDEDDDDDDDDDDDNEEQQKSGDRRDQSRRRGQDRWPERRPSGRSRSDQNAKVDRLRPAKVVPSSKGTTEKPTEGKDETGVTKIGDDDVIINHQDIVDESFEVGVMFASKPIVQAIANPFVGAITNRVGFTLPMFLGFTIMFLSTLVFAFGETYATLFLARAIQGVGSACTSVAGMSMIADRFPDDAERGNAMAVALGGLALGVVLGPPFGGFMYEFFGKPSPFIVLAILALLDGLLQLLVLQPRVTKCQDEGASLMTLIKDPYILVAAGAITFANTGIGILEPALPLWMMDTMQAKNWEQGVAFLPAALSYLFSTNLFGNLGLRIGRWRSAMLGLVIIGCSLLLIPFASRVDHLILPNGAIGFAIGMVDSTMMPMLGYLVDIRHTSVYGSVYAIGDVAFCASFVFGPALSGTLVELIGFEGLIITTALICFAFAPLLVLLRDPPPRQVNEAQMQEQSTLRYVNYSHLDASDRETKSTTTKNYAG